MYVSNKAVLCHVCVEDDPLVAHHLCIVSNSNLFTTVIVVISNGKGFHIETPTPSVVDFTEMYLIQ